MRHLIAALIVVASSLIANAQEEKPSPDPAMQMYIEMARPVRGHERLRTLAGRWDMSLKFWMDPSQPPQAFRGTATGRMILGGRFLQLEGRTTGEFESESLSILGFDRRTDDYTMVGYDTLGTYYITAAGKPAPGDGVVVLAGSYAQPPHGGEQKYRFVWKNRGPDSHTLELYFVQPGGKEALVAETVYRRAK